MVALLGSVASAISCTRATGMPQIVIETSLKHNDQVRTAFPECFLYLVVVIQYLVDIEIVTGIQFVDDLPGGYIF